MPASPDVARDGVMRGSEVGPVASWALPDEARVGLCVGSGVGSRLLARLGHPTLRARLKFKIWLIDLQEAVATIASWAMPSLKLRQASRRAPYA